METSPASANTGVAVLPPGVRPLEPGDPRAIGHHRLLGRLGSGGMGVVYLACDPYGGFVAIKAGHPENMLDDVVRRRFQREVAYARRVPPDCTARVLVDGTDRTPAYVVTEYVDGRPLAGVVGAGGPLRPEQLWALATGVARALTSIHEAGLVHRDLKPANILLTPAGPRVIDFGIAQEVSPSGGLTQAGVVMGSPGWIAPERLRAGPASPASDVFGWGCLVTYAATGRNPFGKGDADQVARRTIEDPPDLDGLDRPLRGLVEAALAKDPADRPTARELLACLGEGTGSVRVWRGGRLKTPVVASALAGSAAVLIVLIATTGSGRDAAAENPPGRPAPASPGGGATASPAPGVPAPSPSKGGHPYHPYQPLQPPSATSPPTTATSPAATPPSNPSGTPSITPSTGGTLVPVPSKRPGGPEGKGKGGKGKGHTPTPAAGEK